MHLAHIGCGDGWKFLDVLLTFAKLITREGVEERGMDQTRCLFKGLLYERDVSQC